jgi:hypothetical protein
MFLAITADGGAYKVMEEAGEMGMIAFYAGLCVGMLLGFLLISLWAFYLAKLKVQALPDPPKEYPHPDSREP